MNHHLLLLLPTACLACACASSPSLETARANVRLVQSETTPSRLLEQGDRFAAVGDTTRAEQYFAAALDAGGPEAILVRRLIRVCVSDHRFPAALDYASNHLRRHPEDRQVRFARAAIEAAVDQPVAAQTDLEAILARAPDDPDVHFALATLLRDKLDDIKGADAHFRRYLQIRPEGAEGEEARGGLLQQEHQP